MKEFFQELKRRNVIKAAIAFIVSAWIVLQVLGLLLPAVNAPDWVFKTALIFLLVAFPFWLIFSWVFEVTEDGIKRTKEITQSESIAPETNKRLNIIIILGLVVVAVLTVFAKPFSNVQKSESITDEVIPFSKSIAVLPFDDMSSTGDNEWFCDGVTDDILTSLSKIKDLKVISRTSTERYKQTDKTTSEIAKELGVSFILEGGVRKFEDQIVITAQLIDAQDHHVWAENYNDSFENIFEIQQKVSAAIASKLRLTLSDDEKERIETKPTQNLEAYEKVLKARDNLRKEWKPHLITESINLYKEAVELDPIYAEAYAELGYVFLNQWFFSGQKGDSLLQNAQKYSQKALLMNPKLSRPYSTIGIIWDELYDEWNNSEPFYEKSMELNPNDATAALEFAMHHRLKPNPNSKLSLIYAQKAYELDPNQFNTVKEYLEALMRDKQFESAKKLMENSTAILAPKDTAPYNAFLSARQHKNWYYGIAEYYIALKESPNDPNLLNDLGIAYDGFLNDDKKSIALFEKAVSMSKDSLAKFRSTALLFNIYCEDHQFDKAKEILESDIVKSMLSDQRKIRFEVYLDYHQGNYEKAYGLAQQLDSEVDRVNNLALMCAATNRLEELGNFINHEKSTNALKAFVYAVLKNRDSMYYYLDRLPSPNQYFDNQFMRINSRFEFDPYRNEERFKAWQRKYYLPTINDAPPEELNAIVFPSTNQVVY